MSGMSETPTGTPVAGASLTSAPSGAARTAGGPVMLDVRGLRKVYEGHGRAVEAGLLMLACTRGFCDRSAPSNVEPDRGKPEMKWKRPGKIVPLRQPRG